MSKEAMKLALETLEENRHLIEEHERPEYLAEYDRVISGLTKALAEQPAQQEPVAVVSGYYGGQCVILPIDPARIFNSNTALYTSPQPAQRKLLTREWINDCIREAGETTQPDSDYACLEWLVRKVEAAHGIKENT